MTTHLTEIQVAERHKQLAQRMETIRTNLLEVRDAFQLHSEQWSSCNAAYMGIAELLDRLQVAGKTLVRYNDPDFYAELVPSLAKDDGGQYAAQQLWRVYPE